MFQKWDIVHKIKKTLVNSSFFFIALFILIISSNIEKIEFLPYHKLGEEKYQKLGFPYPCKDIPEMDEKECQKLYDRFMKMMSEFDAWVNSLDASEQQRVKELRDEWNAANAERLANVKQQATMLNPHIGVEGQTSERM